MGKWQSRIFIPVGRGYTASVMEDKSKSRLILAHSNIEVDILNQAIRRVMQAVGKVEGVISWHPDVFQFFS